MKTDHYSLTLDRNTMRWLLVAATTYVAAGLVANVASVRIVNVAGLAVDAGTLTYPLTFTLRDIVHKLGGRSVARTVVVAGALLNILLALSLWAAAELPADPGVGPQTEFGQVLTPVLRIVVASIVAQILAELIDTELYHIYVRRFRHRFQFGRVLLSNAISVPIDSVVFVVLAFGGDVDFRTAVEIIWVNIAVKGVTSLLTWPAIYSVPDRALERAEEGADPEMASV